MFIRIAIAAACALFAPAVASACTAGGNVFVQYSNAPECFVAFDTHQLEDGYRATLTVENGCEAPITLSCSEGACDDGTLPAIGAPLVVEPGSTVDLQLLCNAWGTLNWADDASEGFIEYSTDDMWNYECGLSALACTAAPGARASHFGWCAFGMLTLVGLRRRWARRR